MRWFGYSLKVKVNTSDPFIAQIAAEYLHFLEIAQGLKINPCTVTCGETGLIDASSKASSHTFTADSEEKKAVDLFPKLKEQLITAPGKNNFEDMITDAKALPGRTPTPPAPPSGGDNSSAPQQSAHSVGGGSSS